jgi:zinc protease
MKRLWCVLLPILALVPGAVLAETPPALWPAPVVTRLDNGLVVAVFHNPRLPVVQVQLAVPAGLAAEDSTQLGASALAASLLRAGTSSRTSAEFQRDLDRIAGVFATNVSREMALASSGFLASDFEAGLELFSDAVINPVFPDEEFEVARRSAARQLGVSRSNLTTIADERVWMAAFAPHPYARAVGGTLGGLLTMSRSQLQTFHRDHWRPDRATLVIAGDVTPERALAGAREWFGRWTGTSDPLPAPPVDSPRRGRVVLVDLPGTERAEIRLARIGPGRESDASAAWSVLAQVLNDSGRLPHGARASWSSLPGAGLFVLAAGAPADSAAELAKALVAAWSRVASRPPSPAEAAAAAEVQARTLPFSLETLGGLSTAWQAGRVAGLADDHLVRAADRVRRGAEAAAIESAARAFAAAPVIVVAGPAERMRDALATLGEVELQPLDESVVPPPAEPPPSPEQLARGRELVEAAVQAHGGAAKLDALKAYLFGGEMVIHNPQQEISGLFEQLRVEPYRLSFLTKILELSTRQVLDGDRAWAVTGSDPPQYMDADSAGVVGLRAVFESDLLHALRFAREPGAQAVWRGTEQTGARPADLVEFRTPAGARVRLVLDGASRRVLALDTAPSPQGVWHDRRWFSDHRLVSGIWFPFREERRVDGTKVSTFRMRTVVVNPPVDEKLFRKPGDKR